MLTIDPDGTERTLVDPVVVDPERGHNARRMAAVTAGRPASPTSCPWAAPRSRCFACSTCRPGRNIDGPIDRARYSPIAWLPDGEAFYYVRRLPTDVVPAGEEQFHRRVYLHRLGRRPRAEYRELFGAGLPEDELLRRVCQPRRPMVGGNCCGGNRSSQRRLAGGSVRVRSRRAGASAGQGRRRTPKAFPHVGREGGCFRTGTPRAGGWPSPTQRAPIRRRGRICCPKTLRLCSRTTRSSTTSTDRHCWRAGLGTACPRFHCTISPAGTVSLPWTCPAWAVSEGCQSGRRAATRHGSPTPTTRRPSSSCGTTRPVAS